MANRRTVPGVDGRLRAFSGPRFGRGAGSTHEHLALARRALELSAAAVILVHNHPSGDPKPSAADVAITREIVAAANAVSVKVHDHLVIGHNGAESFKSLGLL